MKRFYFGILFFFVDVSCGLKNINLYLDKVFKPKDEGYVFYDNFNLHIYDYTQWLPLEIKKEIVLKGIKSCKKSEVISLLLCNLACVNKAWNEAVNDEQLTVSLAQNMHNNFNCSKQTSLAILGTRTAGEKLRLLHQETLGFVANQLNLWPWFAFGLEGREGRCKTVVENYPCLSIFLFTTIFSYLRGSEAKFLLTLSIKVQEWLKDNLKLEKKLFTFILENTHKLLVNCMVPLTHHTLLTKFIYKDFWYKYMFDIILKNELLDINLHEKKCGYTPLMCAIEASCYDSQKLAYVETLLKHPKIDLEKRNFSGKTALEVARNLKKDYTNIHTVIKLISRYKKEEYKK